MTFAERHLLPLGFKFVEKLTIRSSGVGSGVRERLILSFSHLKLQFDCVCTDYPYIRSLGCPLHHEGPGSSWAVEEAKKILSVIDKETIAFEGYPEDGGLYTGYMVIRNENRQNIGFIDTCGNFKKESDDISLTEIEKYLIRKMCKRVYEMPSEYGCLGVGEPPTIPFEQRVGRTDPL